MSPAMVRAGKMSNYPADRQQIFRVAFRIRFCYRLIAVNYFPNDELLQLTHYSDYSPHVQHDA